MARKLDPARAAAALARRVVATQFTAMAVAGTFPQQLAFLECQAPYQLAVCSRRAGKTYAAMCKLLLCGLATPNVVCLYIGLTVSQVKRSAWKTIKSIIRKYNIPTIKTTEDMEIHLTNGSRIYFGSMSDISSIDVYLGESLANGMCYLDEIQSVPLRVIQPLVEDIIEPMLSDTTPEHPVDGILVLSGTFRLASGYMWELWDKQDNEYVKFNWNRLQSPFLSNQQAKFDALVKKRGLTPRLARDWLGVPKFDSTATAYRYDPKKNSYKWTPAAWSIDVQIPPGTLRATAMPPGCDTLGVGCDPGAKDRFALIWWTWNSRKPAGLWQVGEWVTERNANASWNDAGRVLDLIDANYPCGITWVSYDGGGSTVELDLFSLAVGRRAIAAASKSGLHGRVERFASMFEIGQAWAMEGSALEQDFILASWDPAARADGKWKWSSTGIHPDAADAGNYGAEKFWDQAPQPSRVAKTQFQLEEEAWKKALEDRRDAASYGLQNTDLSTDHGGYGPPSDY